MISSNGERSQELAGTRAGDDIMLGRTDATRDREAQLVRWLVEDLVDGRGNRAVVVDLLNAVVLETRGVQALVARSRQSQRPAGRVSVGGPALRCGRASRTRPPPRPSAAVSAPNDLREFEDIGA